MRARNGLTGRSGVSEVIGGLSRAEGCWTFDARDQMPRPSRATAHHPVKICRPRRVPHPARAGSFFRPFVDSTRTNSMLDLVVGHNGIQRFVRRARNLPDAPTDTAASATSTGGVPDRPAPPGAGLPPSRDYAPAGPLSLAAPHLAAQMGWLFPLA